MAFPCRETHFIPGPSARGAIEQIHNQAQIDNVSSEMQFTALHGAPVTTLDFNFMYRDSKTNQAKLRKVAALLGGTISQPFPAISSVFRILRLDTQLQIDLTSHIHGVRSFNALRSNAVRVDFGGQSLFVAALADSIESKRQANRPQDTAVLHVLERTLEEQKNVQHGQT